jgi:hypothetical protein
MNWYDIFVFWFRQGLFAVNMLSIRLQRLTNYTDFFECKRFQAIDDLGCHGFSPIKILLSTINNGHGKLMNWYKMFVFWFRQGLFAVNMMNIRQRRLKN